MTESNLTGKTPARSNRTALILISICTMAALVTTAAITDGRLEHEKDPLSSAGGPGIPEGVSASVLGNEPGQSALAFPDPDRPNRAQVRITTGTGDGTVTTPINGTVRSLLFDPSGSRLLAVVHRQVKRKPAVTHLVSIDTATGKTARLLSLPPTASAIAHRSTTGAILISCLDEIRSYQTPEFVSGPLFRVLGPNGPLAVLPGSDMVLLGKPDGVHLIDLSDPHGTEQMPVHESLPTRSPVDSLVMSGDPPRVHISTADGETFIALLGPLRREGATTVPAPDPVRKTIANKEPPPIEIPAETGETPCAEPEHGTLTEAQEAVPPELPEPATAAPAEQDEALPEKPSTDMETAPPPGTGVVEGKLTGSGATQVLWVRFLGPNNLLTEAHRIRPADDGYWSCSGLVPGVYRIVLDAGGEKVVISSPPFLTLEIDAGQKTVTPPLEVLDVR